MQFSPLVLACAAGLVTFGVSQALAPTAHAQSVPATPLLQAAVQRLHTKQTLGGIELTGQIINTGRQALSYPSVVCVLTNAAGQEVGRVDGYFLAGPVAPGQGVGFRAAAPNMPPFAAVAVRLREAGRPVTVQAANCRTTVR